MSPFNRDFYSVKHTVISNSLKVIRICFDKMNVHFYSRNQSRNFVLPLHNKRQIVSNVRLKSSEATYNIPYIAPKSSFILCPPQKLILQVDCHMHITASQASVSPDQRPKYSSLPEWLLLRQRG